MKRLGFERFLAVLAATASATLSGEHALAATSDAASPESNYVLQEIVVTARKRSDPIQDVPQSVSALSGATLQNVGATQLSDYVNYVPGFNLISDGNTGNQELILRGLTTGDSAGALVGVYVDDTPYGSSSQLATGGDLALDLLPFDIDHVEVLRGPQGTLYGSNTLGGLLKYVTKQPDPSGFAGAVELDGSTVADGGTGGGGKLMLNVPLASWAAFRIAGYNEVLPGWIDDVGLGQKDVNRTNEFGVRPTLLLTPTDSLSIKLGVITQNISNGGTSFEDVDATTHQPLKGDLTQSRSVAEHFNQRYRDYFATVKYDTGFAQLVSATAYSTLATYSKVDETENFGLPSYGTNIVTTDKFTEELRLVSPKSKTFEWLLGGFYTKEDSGQEEDFEFLPPSSPLLHVHFPSDLKEKAAFGDLTWHATSQLDLTLGARYAQNDQNFVVTETGLLAGAVQPGSSSDTVWTWLVNPSYHISPDVMLYARFATGYRPGGPNVLPPGANFPPTFGPDKTTNYEVGVKSEFLDHRLLVDVSVYDIDWKNIQLLVFLNGFSGLGNGKSARSQGVEFSTVYIPVHGLTLGLNGAYTDAKLTGDAAAVGGADGNVLPNVPKFSGAVTADDSFALPANFQGFAGLSARYVDSRQVAFEGNSAIPFVSYPFELKAFGVLDLRTGVEKNNWRLQLNLKNVTDKRAELNAATLATAASPALLNVMQPRTLSLTLGKTF